MSELTKALAEFQAAHHAAGRDGKGNYGTYTTLAGALAAVQPACQYGLSHSQVVVNEDGLTRVRTILMHAAGERLESDVPVLFEGGRGSQMQALGSALTYARRYGLLGIYGVAGDDDDGESAGAPSQPAKTSATPKQSKPPAAKPKVAELVPQEDAKDFDSHRIFTLKTLESMLGAPNTKEIAQNIIAAYRKQFKLGEGDTLNSHCTTKDRVAFIEEQLTKHAPPAKP